MQPLEEMPIGHDDLDLESKIVFSPAGADLAVILRRDKQRLKDLFPVVSDVHEILGQVLRGNDDVAFVPLVAL